MGLGEGVWFGRGRVDRCGPARLAPGRRRGRRVPPFRRHREGGSSGVDVAAGWCAGSGSPIRPSATAVVARPPRRRPRRTTRARGSRRRYRRRGSRRARRRPTRGERRACRWAPHHVRAGDAVGPERTGRGGGGTARRSVRRSRWMYGRRVPALGAAPWFGVPGPVGARAASAGTTQAAERSSAGRPAAKRS
jgi:hypothetical protein